MGGTAPACDPTWRSRCVHATAFKDTKAVGIRIRLQSSPAPRLSLLVSFFWCSSPAIPRIILRISETPRDLKRVLGVTGDFLARAMIRSTVLHGFQHSANCLDNSDRSEIRLQRMTRTVSSTPHPEIATHLATHCRAGASGNGGEVHLELR